MGVYDVVSSRTIYEGKIFTIKQDEIVLENGKTATRDILEHNGACAIRELEEEIGYKSNEFSFMFKTDIAVGYSSEVIYIYLAKGLEATGQKLDEDEFLEIEKYSVDEVMSMIQSGEITDSKTIAGVLYYKNFCV